ncbi:MAG: haloacid dehalogenase-like hydrolase [Candidatus Rokubacteria bacterium]|nr:haloacid dehalogenase-like hydrolase [Candidatus Rokubacteria bacterium]
MRLFLFDIDGTLVQSGGAGRVALAAALREVFGTAGPLETYDLRGRTDPRIVLDVMCAAGFTETEVRARLEATFAAYLRELAPLVAEPGRVRLHPGMAGVVRALAEREDALVGLLTGNIEAGARVKLGPTGLWPLFQVGAFGSDHTDRRQLPAVATARARARTGREFSFARVTIIGDTPLDVDCARACGAFAVAVATGSHPHADLEACAPDLLFADFSDVDAVLAALTKP